MSNARTRDKIIQKFPLPRILLAGQKDGEEEADMMFLTDIIHKIIHEALGNHNEVFLNTFRNIMKEVFYGAPIDQVGLVYFNIPPSSIG